MSTASCGVSSGNATQLLIVEDDAPTSRALMQLLAHYGWTVKSVETVARACSFLDTVTPGSIVLDLMLPDGDGSRVLQVVRARRLDCRVVVTTATGDPMRIARVMAMQPDAFIRKPYQLEQLLGALRKETTPS